MFKSTIYISFLFPPMMLIVGYLFVKDFLINYLIRLFPVLNHQFKIDFIRFTVAMNYFHFFQKLVDFLKQICRSCISLFFFPFL